MNPGLFGVGSVMLLGQGSRWRICLDDRGPGSSLTMIRNVCHVGGGGILVHSPGRQAAAFHIKPGSQGGRRCFVLSDMRNGINTVDDVFEPPALPLQQMGSQRCEWGYLAMPTAFNVRVMRRAKREISQHGCKPNLQWMDEFVVPAGRGGRRALGPRAETVLGRCIPMQHAINTGHAAACCVEACIGPKPHSRVVDPPSCLT